MFNCEIVSQFAWGDWEIFYLKQGGIYSFTIVPHAKLAEIVEHRA